jgi:hypothetical protein
MNSLLLLNCPCDTALRWIKERLAQAGLRTMQTFDLQSARHAPQECPCPHHGTGACDCQMVLLLVYGEGSEPLTLLLHGNQGQTWISLVEEAQQSVVSTLGKEIREALESHLPILP